MAAISSYQVELQQETGLLAQALKQTLSQSLLPPLILIVADYSISPEKIQAKLEIKQMFFNIPSQIAQCKNLLSRCFVLYQNIHAQRKPANQAEPVGQLTLESQSVEQTLAVLNPNMEQLNIVWQTYIQSGILDPKLLQKFQNIQAQYKDLANPT